MSGQFSLVQSGDIQRQNAIYGIVAAESSSCCLSSSVLGVLGCPLLAVVRLHVLLEWILSRFDVSTASWAERKEVSFFLIQWKEDAQRRFSFPRWNPSHRTQTLCHFLFMATHCSLSYYVSDCSVAFLWKHQRSKVLLGNVLNKHFRIFQEFTD